MGFRSPAASPAMPSRRRSRWMVAGVLLSVAAGALQLQAATLDSSPALRFDSARVLDLAVAASAVDDAPAMPVALDAISAQAILEASAVAEGQAPFAAADCAPTPACGSAGEAQRIRAEGSTVRRDGATLTVATRAQPARFVDLFQPADASHDGDSFTHHFIGVLAGTTYLEVEVEFGHDAPGRFLINPANGRVAFLHTGSDVVALAPGAAHLVTFNALNGPLSLRVAALDAHGPRVALQCSLPATDTRSTALFKGWHDAESFDLVLELRAARSRLEHRLALRVSLAGAAQIATADLPALQRSGFGCRAPRPMATATPQGH